MNATLARTLCRVMGHRYGRWANNRALLIRARTCKRCHAVEQGALPTRYRTKLGHAGPLNDPPF